MVYKGIYHLFYQYNPKGADWGNIVWAHSTSPDLINWTPHSPAIYPSQTAGDINGCWSGSATILPGGSPAILYTGIDPQNRQVQNLAVPKTASDPLLIEWVKLPKNPLMASTLENKINSSSFRDPTTAWKGPDGLWRVIIGSKIHRRGLAILYKSKDFVNWILSEQPLHFAEGTGMWECPDFFPVSNRGGLDTSAVGTGIKHVLKLSLDDTKHDYYTIGTYDVVKDIYVPDEGSVDNDTGLRYDYGKFYASKTFYDNDKKRRILWGWINESLPQPEYVKQGWSGLQVLRFISCYTHTHTKKEWHGILCFRIRYAYTQIFFRIFFFSKEKFHLNCGTIICHVVLYANFITKCIFGLETRITHMYGD